jgi:DNA repair ATPase RecN
MCVTTCRGYLADHHLVVRVTPSAAAHDRGPCGPSRIEEVARMSETITDAARKHARELVNLGSKA